MNDRLGYQVEVIAAALVSLLRMQVASALFPGRGFFALSPAEQNIVNTQTQILIQDSKWSIFQREDFQKFLATPPPSPPQPPGRSEGKVEEQGQYL